MQTRFRQIAGFALLITLANPTTAATTTTTFQVDAAVISTCSVSATNLAFGNYDSLDPSPNDATSTVTVQCSLSTTYDIGLDPGTGSGATVASRKMTESGSDTLNYSLYQDASHTQVWGQIVGIDTASGTGDGTAQASTVYGRIPTGQFVTVGNYADTITVTVTF